MSILTSTQFLAEYGCGAYSAGTYQGACTGTTSSNPIDNLANTGYDVLLPIFIGIALLGAGGILLIRRWLRKRERERQYNAQS